MSLMSTSQPPLSIADRASAAEPAADVTELLRACLKLLQVPLCERVYRPRLPLLWRAPDALARIRALLRRAGPRAQETLTTGPLELDRGARVLKRNGIPVSLTFSEFELLGCLMSRPGHAYNRQELLRAIWGDSAYRDPRAIDVHIRHLREKLEARPEEPKLILTVPGRGYRVRER